MSSRLPYRIKQSQPVPGLYSQAKDVPDHSFHAFRKSKRPFESSSSNKCVILMLVLCVLSSIPTVSCFTLTVSSSSIFTGVSANYFLTVTNHVSPTNLILTFSDWSPSLAQPFTSTFVVADNSTGNSLSCRNRISKIIECNISASVFPGSVYPSQIVFRVSGISNPSSLKPYSM